MQRRFTFRLETLLRVRRLREQDVQRRSATVRAALVRLDQQDAQLSAAIREQQAALLRGQSSGRIDPAVLASGRAWIASLRMQAAQRRPERERLLGQLSGLQQELREAHIRTRVLEELRARQVLAHRKRAQQEEQSQQDEAALPRWLRAASGGPESDPQRPMSI